MIGKVILVGAGPGDPELITVKGLNAIRNADVIIYDRLIDKRLLKNAKKNAELIFVGKKPFEKSIDQKDIINIMVEKAREGKLVVRLKGGDPMILGRGGEEIIALAKEKVDFDVVPGITSAIASPTAANIPITLRGVASSFAVIPGIEDPNKPRKFVDLKKLAKAVDTLIILMGVGKLADITRELIEGGMPLDTPAALIEKAFTSSQRVIEGKISDIYDKSVENAVKPPAVLVIGNAVKLREKIMSWRNKYNILLLRPKETGNYLIELLNSSGFNAINISITDIVPTLEPDILASAIYRSYDFIIFTSQISVEIVENTLRKMNLWKNFLSLCENGKVVAIGPKTKNVLEEKGIYVNIIPSEYTTKEVGMILEKYDLEKSVILLFRSYHSDRDLEKKLLEKAAEVKAIYTHRLKPSKDIEIAVKTLLKDKVDALVLTSSIITQYLEDELNKVGSSLKEVSHKTTIFSIGPVTSRKLRELKVRNYVESVDHDSKGLYKTIIKFFGGG